MRYFVKLLFLLTLHLFSLAVHGGPVNVDSLRFLNSAKQNRLIFDVSAVPEHDIALVGQPERLVIDIKNARLSRKLAQPPKDHPSFSKIGAIQKDKDVRIVAKLKRQVAYKSLILEPGKSRGHRLVVDLVDKGPLGAQSVDQDKPGAGTPKADMKERATAKATAAGSLSQEPLPATRKSKKIVVAIDAGHGGEDPGAQGPGGTEEKGVVFSIAKKLAALINGQRGMRAVLVRKGDYYVELRKRMEIAREANADLFLSIHADAFDKSDVKGASVFTLSNRGASSEAARWLADRENASDLVGGISLDDKEETLASVLLDLSQTATQEASRNAANQVLKSFEKIGELHFAAVQEAGFLVLKSPDIPSILVETAFISNPAEERKLKNDKHQSRLALAIFNGVRNYFRHYTPGDARVAGL